MPPAQQAAIVDAVRAQLASVKADSPLLGKRTTAPPEAVLPAAAGEGLFLDTFYLLPLALPSDWPVEDVPLPSRMIPSAVRRLAANGSA